MAPLDPLRDSRDRQASGSPDGYGAGERTAEEALRARLSDNPNDVEAFDQLADLVRRHAAEGHAAGDPQRAVNDAVWALAEEVARSGRAWYPLVELARLSIDDDREVALRRLTTASERDPSGAALSLGLSVLRAAGHAEDALGLGVGHWRPHDHDPEAGRQLVEAAVEAGRFAEARRHLDALAAHPDTERVARLIRQLEDRITAAERDASQRSDRGVGPGTRFVMDVRGLRERLTRVSR